MMEENKDFNITELVQRYEHGLIDGHPGYFDVEELEEIFDFYLSRGRNKESSEVVELGLRMHPNSSTLLLKRATLYMEIGEPRHALQIIDRLPERANQEAMMVRAQILLQLDRREEALRLLHCMMDEENLDTSSLCLDISGILVEENLHLESIEFLIQALRTDERNIDILFELAYCYEQINSTVKAIQTYQKILDIDPYSSETWFNLGQALFNENRYREAIDAYDFALTINPDDTLSLLQKAHSLFQSGQYIQAAGCYEEYGISTEMTDTILVYKGESYEKADMFEEATDCYRKALEMNPKNTDACTGTGICLMEKGEFKNSLAWFEKVLRLDRSISETWVYIAEVFVNLEMPEEALMSYMRALQIDPVQADVLASIGNLFFDAEQYEKALTYYQKAEAIDPEINSLDLFYALVYAKLGANDVSTEYLGKAIKKDEDAQKIYNEILKDKQP
jgi:tetratricopeptide (TPR) repeat protein